MTVAKLPLGRSFYLPLTSERSVTPDPAGYGVVEAGNGLQALGQLNDPRASIRAVLSDIRMPAASGKRLAHGDFTFHGVTLRHSLEAHLQYCP